LKELEEGIHEDEEGKGRMLRDEGIDLLLPNMTTHDLSILTVRPLREHQENRREDADSSKETKEKGSILGVRGNIQISSAKRRTRTGKEDSIKEMMGLIKMMKRRGERTQPCGTPREIEE
jgi:hypothetical protein